MANNTLAQFPVLIDPLAPALEATCDGRWTQMVRVRVKPDTFPFAIISPMVHFFGRDADPKKCRFFLVYDASGVLRYHITLGGGQYEVFPIPPEVNGQVKCVPSLRLTLESDRDADRLGNILATIKAGRQLPDDGAQVLYEILGKDTTTFSFMYVGRESQKGK